MPRPAGFALAIFPKVRLPGRSELVLATGGAAQNALHDGLAVRLVRIATVALVTVALLVADSLRCVALAHRFGGGLVTTVSSGNEGHQ
jgi:hypothetical protein